MKWRRHSVHTKKKKWKSQRIWKEASGGTLRYLSSLQCPAAWGLKKTKKHRFLEKNMRESRTTSLTPILVYRGGEYYDQLAHKKETENGVPRGRCTASFKHQQTSNRPFPQRILSTQGKKGVEGMKESRLHRHKATKASINLTGHCCFFSLISFFCLFV